MSKLKLLHSAI